jgi:hypothetical protein
LYVAVARAVAVNLTIAGGERIQSCRVIRGLTWFWHGRKWAQERTMIKKDKSGYKVLSEKGKNMGGPYKSKAAAQKRLRQVEFFKHKKG